MRFKILLGCLMMGVFALPAHAAPDTVGKVFVGGSASGGLEAPNSASVFDSSVFGVHPGLSTGLFSLGVGISSEVNFSFLVGYGGWSSQTFPSSSEVESLIRFTLMGFQWDWIIHEFENSRILLGSSILVSAFNYPNKPVLAGITEDFEPNIISLTPALIYEHFFGTHLSVGAALSLPLTFSSITWQNNGAANLQKITQTSFAVTTAFEPLMFVRYYF